MRPPLLDPTAGARARAIRERPGIARPTLDPTDPRYREPSVVNGPGAAKERQIFDPTDAECGRQNI